MQSPTNLPVDELTALTTVKNYGDISIVTIPGCTTLLESERSAILNDALSKQAAGGPDDDLVSRLQEMTPPLDEEQEIEETREGESLARKELEREGCPPCYPASLQVPLDDPPDAYQSIISYWKRHLGPSHAILYAELEDWKKFRSYQQRMRRFYGSGRISTYTDRVHERRQKLGLCGEYILRIDVERQSRLENWIEFQDYHIRRLDGFKEKIDELLKQLDDVCSAVHKFEMLDANTRTMVEESTRGNIAYQERKYEQHKVLLQWIEQEREAMETEHPQSTGLKSDEPDAASSGIQVAPKHNRLKKHPRVSAASVFATSAKTRIGRTVSNTGSKPISGYKVSKPMSARKHSNLESPGSVARTSRYRNNTRSQASRNFGLRQFCSQQHSEPEQVPPTTNNLAVNSRRRSMPRERLTGPKSLKRQLARRQESHARKDVMTRSGRISRVPERWSPT